MVNMSKKQLEVREITIWGYAIPNNWLSPVETEYLKSLPENLPSMDWVCHELDRIWKDMRLDNHIALNRQPIGAYYGHPVWLMNGLFSLCDSASFLHRVAIAKYLGDSGVKMVADYGGGFGQLALCIAAEIQDAEIYIVEPYPSKVGIERLRGEPKIKIVSNLIVDKYEAIVAQDVLEHVEDPIKLASEIASSIRIGGKVIFANCFSPVIQSHLPSTFHLRHTFPFVMKALGLRYVATVNGAAHAQIFERVGELNLPKARKAEIVSKLLGPLLNQGRGFLMSARSYIKRIFI